MNRASKEFRFPVRDRGDRYGQAYTIANVVEQVQRPTLVIAHTKPLAAQF